MVKIKYPEKTTLSIGDGANDVSMILKARVGVGIPSTAAVAALRTVSSYGPLAGNAPVQSRPT